MDNMTIFTIAVSISLVIMITYHLWTMNKSESFTASIPASAISDFPSRIYGEDNPVVNYYNNMVKYGVKKPVIDQDTVNNQLLTNNILSVEDHASHAMYYRSNVHRYPIQQAGDPSEHRSTKNAYIAGTRAMRAVRIDPNEAQIPDKLESPVDPN